MKFKKGQIIEYCGNDGVIVDIRDGYYLIEYENGWRRDNSIPEDYKCIKYDRYWTVSFNSKDLEIAITYKSCNELNKICQNTK